MANCELFHFESRTRDNTVEAWERVAIVSRWGLPKHDPYVPDPGAAPLTDPRGLLASAIVANDALRYRRRGRVAATQQPA